MCFLSLPYPLSRRRDFEVFLYASGGGSIFPAIKKMRLKILENIDMDFKL